MLAPGSVAYDTLGVVGAYSALLGILHRDRTGTGQHIDVSAVEALAQMNTWGIPNASASEISGAPASLIRSGDSPIHQTLQNKRSGRVPFTQVLCFEASGGPFTLTYLAKMDL